MELEWNNAGNGVQYAIDGDFLYVRVNIGEDKKAEAPDSKSGKTKVLGTTGGFIGVGQGVKLGLNVTYKG